MANTQLAIDGDTTVKWSLISAILNSITLANHEQPGITKVYGLLILETIALYLPNQNATKIMTTAKDFVKSKFPHAVYLYKDNWNSNLKRFQRLYSIYQDNELDPFTSASKKIGEGTTLEEAWENAQYNIVVK